MVPWASALATKGALSAGARAFPEPRNAVIRIVAPERRYLEGTRNLVFKNTFADIEYVLASGTDNGTRFEFECHATAHLDNLAYFLERGLVKPPLFVPTVFGIQGGIGTHTDAVAHLKRTADRRFGHDFLWSVLSAGESRMPIAAAAAQGGTVRVGLEVASPDEARRLVKLEGRENVGF